MSNCTCIDEGEPDFNGHSVGCPARYDAKAIEYVQIGLLAAHAESIDKYKKEDSERAEAVVETIWRSIAQWDEPAGELRPALYAHVPFLMDVFRAVRGET